MPSRTAPLMPEYKAGSCAGGCWENLHPQQELGEGNSLLGARTQICGISVTRGKAKKSSRWQEMAKQTYILGNVGFAASPGPRRFVALHEVKA